jgi:hypothetical protein
MRRGQKPTRKTTLGVNGEVRSKKDLTGPTLLEMSGYPTTRPSGVAGRTGTESHFISSLKPMRLPLAREIARSFRGFGAYLPSPDRVMRRL